MDFWWLLGRFQTAFKLTAGYATTSRPLRDHCNISITYLCHRSGFYFLIHKNSADCGVRTIDVIYVIGW